MKKLNLILILVLLLSLTLTLSSAAIKEPEIRFATTWPYPFHGNAFGPGAIGGAWWFAYEPFAYYIPATGEYIPRLATSWKLEGNKLVVNLRKTRWSDGTPFTAKDIECNIAFLHAMWEWPYEIAGVEVRSENTVALVLSSTHPFLIHSLLTDGAISTLAPYHIYGKFLSEAKEVASLGRKIWELREQKKTVPEDLKKDYDKKAAAFREKVNNFSPIKEIGRMPVVGTYEPTNVTQTEMVLTKNKYHWAAGKIRIPRVVFRRWSSNEFVWASLVAGEIDAAHPSIPKDVVDQFNLLNPNLKLKAVSDLSEFALIFNFEKLLFKDLTLRKAIAYALNRTKIRDVAAWQAKDVSDYAHGVLKSMEKTWLSADFLKTLTNYSYNPAKAEAILKEAGYTKGSDGLWRTPDGKVVAFTVSVYGPHSDWVLAAREITEQLKNFGFKVDLKIIPEGMRDTVMRGGDYEAAVEFGTAWWGYPHPAMGYTRIYQGEVADFTRFPAKSKFKTPWGDLVPYELTDKLQEVTTKPAEAKDYVMKLAYITNEYLPMIPFLEKVLPLFYLDGKRVTGWPEPDDSTWSLAPGGIERVYVLLLSEGKLRPKL